MTLAHQLGFPRIGARRQLKSAVEQYWQNKIDQNDLTEIGHRIKTEHWQMQIAAQHDFLTVGDFSWYDHVLDMSCLLGVIPNRFMEVGEKNGLDTYFRMARGRGQSGPDVRACEMTKWFDTNYHYIVPEFSQDQSFQLCNEKLFAEVIEAKKLNKSIKPVLLGPLTYLWLGKTKTDFDKLSLLETLHIVYQQIFSKLFALGVEWVQIDEPILVLDLPTTWQRQFAWVYEKFTDSNVKLLLTTYFGGLNENTKLACQLPTGGLHVDLVKAPEQIHAILDQLPAEKILSAGIIDGRNIWRSDLKQSLATLKWCRNQLQERLWVGSSCSLLHSPVDLDLETTINPEIKNWLAFAKQKLHEISLLTKALNEGESAIQTELEHNQRFIQQRRSSLLIHNPDVKERCRHITNDMTVRKHAYALRSKIQKDSLNLPLFSTTTIGSFPQTNTIRNMRKRYKENNIDAKTYQQFIKQEIASVIQKQLDLGIDVLVHGESERNDMVEYFGELLNGFVFTQNGWVQSYGTRCVKPPIIYGDVSRPQPMTIEWLKYAQSLTDKPVKGMLTGPNTILSWSFVRDDQSRYETTKQIALALHDEVKDLIQSGIRIIQIDEPAFREGLPLKKKDWQTYLKEAVQCFRLSSCDIPDEIQIHTHMCYSEFNDIIQAVADLDADVITIENSRSDMELLKAFEDYHYPNDIGPGVYDIHSPRIPTVDEMVHLMEKAAQLIPIEQLWINPDCGLKTRNWEETLAALKNMVTAAHKLRLKYKNSQLSKVS